MTYFVHTRPGCEYCTKAKELLRKVGETYVEFSYDTEEARAKFKAQGFTTYPQIYQNDVLIGGFTELTVLFRDAEDF